MREFKPQSFKQFTCMEIPKHNLIFENLWKKDTAPFHAQVMELWIRNFPNIQQSVFTARLNELAFIVRTTEGRIVGISTAYNTYIDQLKNNLYAFRCFIDPDFRIPGLTTKLVITTRDWLEEIHLQDGSEELRCIGMITLVENERIMKVRNEAIWRASKMVYIGNTPAGKHIRVYYFENAII